MRLSSGLLKLILLLFAGIVVFQHPVVLLFVLRVLVLHDLCLFFLVKEQRVILVVEHLHLLVLEQLLFDFFK